MVELNEKLFDEIEVEDLKNGYVYDEDAEAYVCLVCNKSFEQGVIYPMEDKLYEAKKAIRIHTKVEHGDVFQLLLNLGKENTGISEIQRVVLQSMYNGASDKQIARALGGKSVSTVRNHRFQLRKRQKEARIFLALMKLMEERDMEDIQYVEFDTNIPKKDERFVVTLEEEKKIRESFFNKGPGVSLKGFPKKQKIKLVILNIISQLFESGKEYSETEVNEILGPIYEDHLAIRRYLIDYEFLDRLPDGSRYWKKQ